MLLTIINIFLIRTGTPYKSYFLRFIAMGRRFFYCFQTNTDDHGQQLTAYIAYRYDFGYRRSVTIKRFKVPAREIAMMLSIVSPFYSDFN